MINYESEIVTLLKYIKEGRYNKELLMSVPKLEAKMSKDLEVNKKFSGALLGFAFYQKYAFIDDKKGLVLNYNNEKIKSLVESGSI